MSARVTQSYEGKPFSQRENLFLLSGDQHDNRTFIVNELKKNLPQYRFITIKRMTYDAYRQLVSRAKFSLTFGEGLDGYYAEMILSGGIGCAVFNGRFFTEDFSDIPFVYASWEALLENLPKDVHAANVAGEYERLNEIPYRILDGQYSYEAYQENMASFYKRYYP